MILATCIAIGVVCSAGVYMMVGRSLKDVCMGLFLFSHGVNLAVVVVAGSPTGKFPPVLGEGQTIAQLADPLPQALVLTAVVIGFAVQAFLLTLLVAMHRHTATLDLDKLAANGKGSTPTSPASSASAPATAATAVHA